MRRKFSQTLVSCALMASVSVACGQADQTNSESKVYGGSKVKAGEWGSTIALSQGGSMYCSGTAITPYVVISAAHCAEGMSASSVTVYVGDGKDGGSVKGQYAVSKIVGSPKYNGNKGNDISYVVLKTPLDLPESAYVPVLTDSAEIKELLAIGAKAHIVGFGLRNGNGFGLKYEVDTTVVKSISTSLSYDAANEIAIGGGGKDSCNGDSGGPVYGQLKSGEWRVYGITSRGGSCGTGGIYGLMHSNICWVQEDSGLDLGLPAGVCGDVETPTQPEEPTTPTTPTTPTEPTQPSTPDNNDNSGSTGGICDWWPGLCS
ncbi:MAG: trypsin-like serine protease [Proteobacteria bacterium]|nr:MAG: trypsin-like serine protease [Pseudomonadota bacterium]